MPQVPRRSPPQRPLPPSLTVTSTWRLMGKPGLVLGLLLPGQGPGPGRVQDHAPVPQERLAWAPVAVWALALQALPTATLTLLPSWNAGNLSLQRQVARWRSVVLVCLAC